MIYDTGRVNENDILQALSGASTLLRDVESAFRDICKDDAEEIADVGLTLARLFLMSLQSIYGTLTPENLLQGAEEQQMNQQQYQNIREDHHQEVLL